MLGLNPNWNPTIKKRFDSKPYLPWSRFSICVSFFVVILPPFNLPVRDVSSTSKDSHFNFAESKIWGTALLYRGKSLAQTTWKWKRKVTWSIGNFWIVGYLCTRSHTVLRRTRRDSGTKHCHVGAVPVFYDSGVETAPFHIFTFHWRGVLFCCWGKQNDNNH